MSDTPTGPKPEPKICACGQTFEARPDMPEEDQCQTCATFWNSSCEPIAVLLRGAEAPAAEAESPGSTA